MINFNLLFRCRAEAIIGQALRLSLREIFCLECSDFTERGVQDMVTGPDRLGNLRHTRRRNLSSSGSLLSEAALSLAVIFAGALLLAVTASLTWSLGWDFIAVAMLILALIFALALYTLPGHLHPCFGHANRVTAIRSALVSLVGATVLLFDRLELYDPGIWTLLAIVLLALLLDGLDGYLARRFGQVSEFGARFDMEIDALLILILSVAAVLFGKAGVWVVLIGLMRYAFVVAQWFQPRLAGQLPASFRRKLICVLQIAALCLVLVPFVLAPASTLLAGIALVLLAYSFAVDVRYLLRPSDGSP
jgi:phosphatidylglycerophosphate synthase